MKDKSLASKQVIQSIMVFTILMIKILLPVESVQANQNSELKYLRKSMSKVDRSWMLSTAVEFRYDFCNPYNTMHAGLGTKLGQQAVLTHNHYGKPASFCMVDQADPQHPQDLLIKTASLAMGHNDEYGDQTQLVRSTENFAGSFAPIASQQVISQLAVGEFVDVVYWNDANQGPAIARFRIQGFLGDSLVVLEDPEDIINVGDSGGGVFYRGTLIGNTWRYFEILDQDDNRIGKEVHVQILPPVLSQVLENW